VLVRHEDHVSPVAAVAAVRAAARDVLFAAKPDRPMPAVAPSDADRNLVNKHVWFTPTWVRNGASAGQND
jgi:hypothetical protein